MKPDVTQIILIVLIVALIIIYPIMIYVKNKKQRQQMQEQTNSLKRGDRVLTASGVYGKIVDLHQDGEKLIVTIETGTGENKGYLAVDAYAIYSIMRDETKLEEVADAVEPQEISEKQEVVEENEVAVEVENKDNKEKKD